MYILIPAYQPDVRLVGLVSELRDAIGQASILVIDDGSGVRYAHLFDAVIRLGAKVIAHPVNRGKGESLKLGFEYIRRVAPDADVVTADADGQHRVEDIAKVAAQLRGQTTPSLVLGVRSFTGAVPVRSRAGNLVSRWMLRFATGLAARDTQTGLRGYPAALLEWACLVPGERFEYELAALLDAATNAIPVQEVDIETVYLGKNEASHFRPLLDSLRALRPLIGFGAVSMVSFLLDFVALLSINAITGDLLISVVAARVFSGTVNFALNRSIVFRPATGRRLVQAARYGVLAVVILTASYFSLLALTSLGVPLALAKILSDVGLYLVSYAVQRRFVFRRVPKLEKASRAIVHSRERVAA